MVHLRAANPSDLAAVQELDKTARSRYVAHPELIFAATSPPIALERLQTGELVVAELEGRIAGFILMNAMDGGLYIANISVGPGLSGQGIGAGLMEEAVRRAGERGLNTLMLTTFRAPQWNGPWFRKFGYVPMPDEMIGPELRAIIERQSKFVDPKTREVLWRAV